MLCAELMGLETVASFTKKCQHLVFTKDLAIQYGPFQFDIFTPDTESKF